jgi:DNA-binding MarR family transcriptional regulator
MRRKEEVAATPDVADPLGACSNATLRKAARRLGKLYDDALAPSGLRATQYVLLIQIGALGTPTMAELAKSLLMDLSATRHSLGPLIRDRMVKLRVDTNDRRVKRVSLTAAGEARSAEAGQLWRRAQDHFERAFGSARAARLREELSVVASATFEDALLSAGELRAEAPERTKAIRKM